MCILCHVCNSFHIRRLLFVRKSRKCSLWTKSNVQYCSTAHESGIKSTFNSQQNFHNCDRPGVCMVIMLITSTRGSRIKVIHAVCSLFHFLMYFKRTARLQLARLQLSLFLSAIYIPAGVNTQLKAQQHYRSLVSICVPFLFTTYFCINTLLN